MPDKFKSGGFPELITPLNEEGNRTSNDPATGNVPSDVAPPDPMGLTHGQFTGGGRKGGAPPKRK